MEGAINWLDDRGLRDRTLAVTAALLCFLFSFFYATMFTEPLFLFLTLAVFVCFELRRWWLASLAMFALVLTRPTGVVILPCVLILLFKLSDRGWKPWLPIVSGLSGLVAFAVYQYIAFGTPLAYVRTHAAPPGHVTPRQIMSDLLLHSRPGMPGWYLGFMLAIGLIFLAAVPAVYRRLGGAYALFVALSVLLRISSSLPGLERYVIVAFPVFLVMTYLPKRRFISLVTVSFYIGLLFAGFLVAGYGVF